ncbi:PqiA/YebS family transporter subunit [Saccharophagus degradans]|uniref:paraquat-inducible protein A n=1 Tax=Saccharophagus degradans TaxID=86304 RepID=UPI002477D614|nr:PqiA/YebS family transporter subunit [Saccharophagus degradans]WGO99046.1 PqiA/YebS family transporter subunit [Saccharophagus degradans]
MTQEFLEQQRDWLICHDCGEIQKVVAISPEHEMLCFNCGASLHSGKGRWLAAATALSLAALVLFIACNFLPFLTLEIGMQSHTTTIMDGVGALMARNQWLLAGLVVTTTFLFPLFEICAYMYVLLPYQFNRRMPGHTPVLRWLIQAQSWSMLEVFMLSVVITTVKLTDMAVLKLGPGAYLFFMLVAILQLIFLKIDRRKLWQWINTNNYFSREENEYAYDCRICQALVGESIVVDEGSCPRCDSAIHKRIPASLQKTTALVVAATLLYIPANVLPIMEYTSLGITEKDTIFSGVIELLKEGLWGIATIVFVASILVPIAKLVILYYLIWAVKAKVKVGVKHRTVLYRLIEVVGRWSMVDVYVVTILVALVQFGFIYTVEPEGAIIAFGAVVVLTMLAAESFDPRLLWDASSDEDDERVKHCDEHTKPILAWGAYCEIDQKPDTEQDDVAPNTGVSTSQESKTEP